MSDISERWPRNSTRSIFSRVLREPLLLGGDVAKQEQIGRGVCFVELECKIRPFNKLW